MTSTAPTPTPRTPTAFSRLWNKGLEYLQYGPKFLRQRPVFAACRMAYYARYTPEPPSPETAAITEQLERDGAVVIRGLFERPAVGAMLDEVRDGLRRLSDDGELPGMDVYVSRDYGIARILKADDHYPATRAFFEHETVWQVARAYVSTRVQSYLRMAELRDRVGAISSSDIAHFDDWRKRFKAFVLLNDVDEGHAPFVYYRGSHKGGAWRARAEFEYFREGRTGRFGHFFPHEWEAIVRQHGHEKMVCTGPAGTVILTDTRGVHHGTPVQAGPRYLLGAYFDVRQ